MRKPSLETPHRITSLCSAGDLNLLLRKGFRDSNNLTIDMFLKQKRKLKNTVVSKTLIPGLHFDDFRVWTAIHTVE